MSSSFKDQLLGLGFKASVKPEQKPKSLLSKTANKKTPHQRDRSTPKSVPAKHDDTMDLGKAFALRQQQEKNERELAEREKQEKQRQRALVNTQIAQLLQGQILNRDDAEIVRHFQYKGKIKRLYVNADQLAALNSGVLAVVQHKGRFCLVHKDLAMQVHTLIPDLLALYCDGSEQQSVTEYSEPHFQVPDDLLW